MGLTAGHDGGALPGPPAPAQGVRRREPGQHPCSLREAEAEAAVVRAGRLVQLNYRV
ncbi:hypothetical protein ACIREO_00930 [Streptomyces sp. NPDC102441]|uniref:hypothetical protein n=1 Tax=Streptomyces sp. NPDC102441 TaxID=3366176 RepID=UPI003817DC2A